VPDSSSMLSDWLSDRLRFAYHCLCSWRQREYLAMGYRVAARYQRCHQFWQPHLRCTREAILQAQAALPAGPACIQILGAGRLLDVPVRELTESGSMLHCVDADPGLFVACGRFPASIRARLKPQLLEISGHLDTWKQSLVRAHARHVAEVPDKYSRALSQALSELRIEPQRVPCFACDFAISLNLLSQLPLFWEDFVHALVRRKLPAEEIGNPELDHALKQSQQQLLLAHQQQLVKSAAKLVLVVADEAFLYYERQHAEWVEKSPLLTASQLTLAGYQETKRDSWFWHIAPQELEQPGFGVLHQVMARRFERV
jgi:hypothetical protein